MTKNLKEYGDNENFVKSQKKIFWQIKSRIGVLCMSKTPKNILKGVVYEFDKNLFKDNKSEKLRKRLFCMKYNSSYEPLSYIPQNGEDAVTQFAKSLKIKAKDWRYEKEVRFLNVGKSGIAINFNPTSLKTIIFGERTPKGEIGKTISFCQDNHLLNHIHFQQAYFMKGSFELSFKEINPKDFK